MMEKFQRTLVRFAAIAAILFGAIVAIVVAGITLLAGLAIGIVAAAAAWFGMRSRRAVPGTGAPWQREGRREVTVIDVEMRELDPREDSKRAAAGGARPDGSEAAGDAARPGSTSTRRGFDDPDFL